MHYLVHYPAHIYRFGPMIWSWCMRYEAKHSYFKRLASYLGNFTNVALSLAERHQTRSCYLRNQPIAKKPKIDSAKEIVAKDSEHYYLLKEKEPNLSDISILSSVQRLGKPERLTFSHEFHKLASVRAN
ncbi:uncharacterized protein LOC124442044 isoform X2 [Xenia sp. Carnegie-2017]|uniref:uncharacterized protein LOC124442044 isoform X2 n=1 Tax=Xenia sp. Carnegie-2017 TaxID=2897299 RepID=UPI001F04E68D|nr:uncharacterized protein LOC124442044 isoform X2 [Xenia sp. Carnegie-2017]